MRLFHNALLRLTALYVGVLMLLALACSVWLYNAAGREVRIVRAEVTQTISSGTIPLPAEGASKGRLLQELLFFNIFILGAGTLASYVLARQTLRPLKAGYDAQVQFAADASHELRTPLTTLKAELQLARREANRVTPARYMAAIDSSLEEVERLSSLTARLLRLTNPQANDTAASAQLQAALDMTLRQLQKSITAKQLKIVRPIGTDTLFMHQGDLVELLTIILDNAIAYSPPKSTIAITTSKNHANTTITIQDSGAGIAPEDLPHIFDRFYRGKQPKDRKHPGYGLGLSVARKITQSARGSIAARSTSGKGATFIITLPTAISA